MICHLQPSFHLLSICLSLRLNCCMLSLPLVCMNCACLHVAVVAGTHDYAKDRRREREAKQKKLKVLEEARRKSEHSNRLTPQTICRLNTEIVLGGHQTCL